MVNGNERTMRSAIALGLGMVILAATPALWAQANPATPNSAKPGQSGPAKPTAQQAAKPTTPATTKPAPQTAAKPAAPAATKPAPQPAAKPGLPAAPKPTPQAANPAGKPAAKGAAKSKAPAKRAAKTVEKPRTPGAAPAAAESEVKQARRDPFESLLGRQSNKAPANLPPGKLGLQVSTLPMDGVSFHEEGKDAFGKPVERQVNKRIYSSPGEQQ